MRPEHLGKIALRSVFYQNHLNSLIRSYSSSSSVKPSSLSIKINDESELLNPTYKIQKKNSQISKGILIEKYHELIDSNKFRYDRKQFDTLFMLSSFYRQILDYQLSTKPIWSNHRFNKFIKNFFNTNKENELPKMKSIYLYGGVGKFNCYLKKISFLKKLKNLLKSKIQLPEN